MHEGGWCLTFERVSSLIERFSESLFEAMPLIFICGVVSEGGIRRISMRGSDHLENTHIIFISKGSHSRMECTGYSIEIDGLRKHLLGCVKAVQM